MLSLQERRYCNWCEQIINVKVKVSFAVMRRMMTTTMMGTGTGMAAARAVSREIEGQARRRRAMCVSKHEYVTSCAAATDY